MSNTSIEQQIFELVESIGERVDGDLHIVLQEYDEYEWNDVRKASYRVYHKKGICFDITLEAVEDEETGDVIDYTYDLYMEWEGFDTITEEEILELIVNNK